MLNHLSIKRADLVANAKELKLALEKRAAELGDEKAFDTASIKLNASTEDLYDSFLKTIDSLPDEEWNKLPDSVTTYFNDCVSSNDPPEVAEKVKKMIQEERAMEEKEHQEMFGPDAEEVEIEETVEEEEETPEVVEEEPEEIPNEVAKVEKPEKEKPKKKGKKSNKISIEQISEDMYADGKTTVDDFIAMLEPIYNERDIYDHDFIMKRVGIYRSIGFKRAKAAGRLPEGVISPAEEKAK